MDAYKTLVLAHVLCGCLALATFWLAALVRKGSPLHRAAGRVYLLAMIGICASAAPMSVVFHLRGLSGMATFLAYLVLITATAMWLGWRSIRRKRDQAGFRDRAYLAVATLNIAASMAVFVIGANLGQVLLMGFSAIGLVGGSQMLLRLRRPMPARNWWLQEHYGAMVGCGAATHVAFLGIGLNRLAAAAGMAPPPGYWLLAWILPVAAAFVAAALLDRRHRPKPAPVSRATAGA